MKKQAQRENKHPNKMFIDKLSLMVKPWRQPRYPEPGGHVGKSGLLINIYNIKTNYANSNSNAYSKKGHMK